jgi:hypothetical protein
MKPDPPEQTHSGGTSRNGTHRAPPSQTRRIDEAAALPSPAVLLSALLSSTMAASDTHPLPGLPVIRHVASDDIIRRSPGRGGPLQFPSPLSIRSEPHTPESSWAPALPGLQHLPWPSP